MSCSSKESSTDPVDPTSIELNMLGSDRSSSEHFGPLTEFLKEYMPDICVKEQHGDQITYTILDDIEHTRIFPAMLMDLDANKEHFGIKSYGLSNSSLEQVFLRVADETKRVEDYERLSRWKRFRNCLQRCCGKKVQETENPTIEEDSQQTDNDEQLFSTALSGKLNSLICSIR